MQNQNETKETPILHLATLPFLFCEGKDSDPGKSLTVVAEPPAIYCGKNVDMRGLLLALDIFFRFCGDGAFLVAVRTIGRRHPRLLALSPRLVGHISHGIDI